MVEVVEVLSFDAVEARLIEAVGLQRRTEGGRWPFATDGPWHQIRRKDRDPYMGGDKSPARMPRLPLGRAEVGRLEEAAGWLALVPNDRDRKLIVLAVTMLADGFKAVRWSQLTKVMGEDVTAGCLARRYGRAMTELTQRVNVALRVAREAKA